MENAIWYKCNGEAHSNPYIDHCMVCMPFWGQYPVCPYCKKPRSYRSHGIHKTKCRGCGKYYTLERRDPI